MPRWPVSDPPASRSSEVASDSDITILRISEEAEEDAELLVYLEQQGLTPGVHAHVAHVSQSRDSVTIDGPRGQSSMGLRPASLIRVLLWRCRPVAVPPGPGVGRAARALVQPAPMTSPVLTCEEAHDEHTHGRGVLSIG